MYKRICMAYLHQFSSKGIRDPLETDVNIYPATYMCKGWLRHCIREI